MRISKLPPKKQDRANFNDCRTQQFKILEALKKRPMTTVEIRHELDILGVAPRIFELRHQYGYNIQTKWTYDENPGGSRHFVALYVLLPGKWEGSK